jgi:excisionase family DNA binding protein
LKKSIIDVVNNKVYVDNKFSFYSGDENWVAVYVDLSEYKKSETIFTIYFSHIYCNLLDAFCKELKMSYLFSFIPYKSSIDNKIFFREKESKIKNKEVLIRNSAYLQHVLKTFEDSNYDIFAPQCVHALFEFDDINTIEIVRNVLISYLVSGSDSGISENLKIFKKNTKKVLKLKKANNSIGKVEVQEELEESLGEEVQVRIEDAELKSIAETAKAFKVSKQTIHNWTKQGKIISHKIGRRVYYKKSDLMESLERVK